jgi:hypothetical protein
MRAGCTGGLVLLAGTLIPLVGTRSALAYEPQHTHRWIARQAIEHLLRVHGERYAILREHAEVLVDGVEHEDDAFLDGDSDPFTLRLMRHFFRPLDGAGLTRGDQAFPSSFEWGGVPNDQNQWGYDDALAHYQAGDLPDAFFALGHVVHLIQDATVPAHTHLDEHGPPYADNYEDWCADQLTSEFEGALPLPPPDAEVPDFASLEEAWQVTASASYWRNMVPGRLSAPAQERASGPIARMFPDIEVNLTRTWTIPDLGNLDKAFFEHQPDHFYFKKALRAGEVDRIDFDPYDPQRFDYGPSGDAVLAENIARDMVPLAVLHSAAVMKLFVDQAAELEPPPDDPAPPAETMTETGGCSAAGASASPALLCLLALACVRRRRS